MADDMIDSLENMKLIIEEDEEIIAISDEGRQEAIVSCNLSLIGKFLMCKPFNILATKSTVRRAWGLDEKMQILEVRPNLFQFKFQSEFDMTQIFRGDPWSFDNINFSCFNDGKRNERGDIKMELGVGWVRLRWWNGSKEKMISIFYEG